MEALGWEVLSESVALDERQVRKEIAHVNKREFVLGKGIFLCMVLFAWMAKYIVLMDSIIKIISKTRISASYLCQNINRFENIRPIVSYLAQLRLPFISPRPKTILLGTVEYDRM
jgi:hypothetical protein